ncbi:histidine kinase dimerization/phospho-acceptor domain-containing protein [Desulfobacter sp.]|uniref:histidine kinase dimerization/phospho-acceptor domain-containing protein n=1 Tax=Desulfobacter sp. TaxID=2294 RepID=UPI003D13D54D
MKTLGILAGGIAHDFNNLLMAIMGYADFAKMKSYGQEVEADLDNIIAISKQMANLVKQLLSFSRREKDKMELIEFGPGRDCSDFVQKIGIYNSYKIINRNYDFLLFPFILQPSTCPAFYNDNDMLKNRFVRNKYV